MKDSFVAMEQEMCPVCCTKSNVGVVIDRRLRPIENKVTGWSLCEEHAKQKREGYVFIIGADESKSDIDEHGNIMPEGAHRTGDYCAIRREAWERMFDIPIPEKGLAFAEPDVMKFLGELQQKAEEDGDE